MQHEGWPTDWSHLSHQHYLQALKNIRSAEASATSYGSGAPVPNKAQQEAMAFTVLMQEVDQIGKSLAHLAHFNERREMLMEQLFPAPSLN